MQIRFPGESADYRTARDRLLEREIELRRAMEAVAAARRALPPGGAVPEDYVFEAAAPDGKAIQVRLSELFAPGKDSLVIYNFMFPHGSGGPRPAPTSGGTAVLPLEEGPCPSCTALLDQLDGATGHVSRGSTLPSSRRPPRRALSPSETSAVGGTYDCSPRPATRITATTSVRTRTDGRKRCSMYFTARAR